MPASTTPPESLLRNPTFVIAELHRVGREDLEGVLAAEGLSLRTHWILCCLEEPGELSQKQVAEVLGVDRSDMVRLLDDLEERGFVARAKNAKDRRKHVLSLTKSGRQVRERSEELTRKAFDQLYGNLSAKERQSLQRLVLKALGLPKKYADPPT
ncbi:MULTISPECIES: MarR family winged helix-turn-helix transcriptional regulator [Rhodococcus]|nr:MULTISPECIES: MarR family transcriptional regulator [Rhodococcus]KAF0966678.1 Transcriptional regulator SlyA [Rhodococcus sp. T7]QQZ18319.1 MarR family transcriptional regulator [Rhodococcus sp. 21391]UOT08257.1 MarR family transcriptional regulator [Rhodococcus opacus]BAH55944.1 putative MarR family transcriptional regulator [Rhodococcus opacus B4]